ncbi:hypothetical protein [Arthrobacter bambusae]|uniref:hypothetical protein n=1 Tax=Arthrobacter bambusae TaxID=1338426 RepID=UPI0027821C25|nr:hypothetical protein [Arthrobacter bambusae]MDQ0028685.1 hypothetical protein [Arthrobacter bambusae]MDQ0096521.1 hypothetical protein [Arthrobacter bambusae]
MYVGQEACSVIRKKASVKVRLSPREAVMLGSRQAGAGMPDAGVYFQWGDFLIQFGNLVVITTMVVLFILALVIPFPHGRKRK